MPNTTPARRTSEPAATGAPGEGAGGAAAGSTMADPTTGQTITITDPVILDLGKVSRKKAKRLKRGEGSLLAEVQDAVAETVGQLGDAASGKEILPVVILYRKKRKKASGLFPFA